MGPLKGELRLAREAFLGADYVQAVQHCNTAIQLGPASYDAQLCVCGSPPPTLQLPPDPPPGRADSAAHVAAMLARDARRCEERCVAWMT